MHPTGRPLDAEFESGTPANALPPSDGTEMVIQDFNAFFEKLSGLDDVRWTDEPPAADPAPQAASAKPAPAAPVPPQAAPARAPATATPPAHLSPAGKGQRMPPHRSAPPPPSKADPKPGLPLAFKLAMTALVLFAVGMGAGWLALSLPRSSDHRTLAENQLIPLENGANSDAAAKPDSLASPWDALKAKAHEAPAAANPADAKAKTVATAAAKPAAPAPAAQAPIAATEGTTEAPVKPEPPVAPAAPEISAHQAPTDSVAAADADETDAFSQQEPVSVPKAPAPQPVTIDLPKSDIFAKAHAAVTAAPALTVTPRTTPPAVAATPSAPAAAQGEQYAVQVGACTSSQCVDNYRKLIQPHVGTHPVQVVQQAVGKGPAVQRVRVEPLTKDQAQSLQQALSQADTRLRNAYVVKLADR